MHTKEEAQALIREYHREDREERLGQYLMNRMPIRVVDPEVYYCKDPDEAASMYVTRYTYASPAEMLEWTRSCNAEGIPAVSITLAKSKIRAIEFKVLNSTTYCFITAVNGHVCIGQSSTVYKKRFNFDVGKKMSFNRAFEQLMEHLAYQERDKVWYEGQADLIV